MCSLQRLAFGCASPGRRRSTAVAGGLRDAVGGHERRRGGSGPAVPGCVRWGAMRMRTMHSMCVTYWHMEPLDDQLGAV